MYHWLSTFTDDECDLYGIQMVKLQDPQLVKRYGIKTFPSLVYFRNGNPLTYDGEVMEELPPLFPSLLIIIFFTLIVYIQAT